jgi:hypothetical protein
MWKKISSEHFLNLNKILFVFFVGGSAFLLPATIDTVYAANAYEVPRVRSAKTFLDEKILKGPHHTVRDVVSHDGYGHRFTVDSDFGVFKASGDAALRKLVKEIAAIAALREIKQSDAFAQAVEAAAKAPFQFAGNLIDDPVDTIESIPSGLFQIFENVAAGVTEKHDPSEDSRLKQALFVSSWKRDFAKQFGVDVYSSNKVLQEELNSVGWAGAIGGLTVSAATAPLSGTAAVVVKSGRMADQIGNALGEQPPSRLRIENDKILTELNIPQKTRDAFLDHPAFTPRHDTVITLSLASLNTTQGHQKFLESALAARDEIDANLFEDIAETLAHYHANESPIVRFDVHNGLVLALARNGAAVFAVPLDHGAWTQTPERIFADLKQNYPAAGKLELWVTGTVSERTKQELSAQGIKLVEDTDKRFVYFD